MHPCLDRPAGVKRTACPVDGLMPRLGDKWTIHVMAMLQTAGADGLRFSELKNGIKDISQKMLTVTLRALERDGLIIRTVFPEVPPRVEYKMTELGTTLLPAMHELMDWLQATWPVIQRNREQFDGQSSNISHTDSA
ncbi:MAG TPA: helix-turn-helix domain-containing protein [Magnetospirillaceae bacterium]|nr:helix-turn-helix domain-containing protein [Magnetospirillaceae bacterium]